MRSLLSRLGHRVDPQRRIRSRLVPLLTKRDTVAAAWPVAAENARGHACDGVTLRRYPYPYRCALAVNNDTDGFTYPAFQAFHGYVSGRGETPFGPGLGLEIADSFWVWSTGGQVSLYHGAPWEDAPASPEHERLVELARAGWLDTLHGFGAWNEDWTLDRDRIRRALDYLSARDVALKVYVSHGGYNMAHNIGGPWGYYQHADNPGNKSYCLDLLLSHGFRYFWTDVFYEIDKFGDDWLFDSQAELEENLRAHDFARYFHANDPADYTRSRPVFPSAGSAVVQDWHRKLFNRPLVPVTARDGHVIHMFKRYRGNDGPQAGNFVGQVNKQSLDLLERHQGAAIVYQHFGVWRAMCMGKKHPSQRPSRPEDVLDEHGIWAFRELAERQRQGRVFVATTRRLLDYLRIRDGLDFRVERLTGKCLIHVNGLDCPAQGRLAVSAEDLAGITFQVPRAYGEAELILDGVRLPATVTADPSDELMQLVALPWVPLEYPS